MIVPPNILDLINLYHQTYRHPALSAPEVSNIYALFPGDLASHPPANCWPADWLQGNRPGVYLIFNAQMGLLYIGKATSLALRLSNYFKYLDGRGTGCRVVHEYWTARPSFVVTVALAKAFEASSLEEYLIGTLNPPDNKVGVMEKA